MHTRGGVVILRCSGIAVSRVAALWMIIFLWVGFCPLTAQADDGTLLYGNYYYYTINSAGEAVIKDVRASIKEAVVPQKIGEYTVTEIGAYSFKDCTRLVTLSLPSTIRRIGDCAFYGCTKLSEVHIPETVTQIGWGILENTPWLSSQTAEFVTIGDNILLEYNGSSETVTIPDTIKQIGGYAFFGNDTMKKIVFPGTLVSIGNFAFDKCTALEEISFSEGLLSLGAYAFHWCTALREVELPDSLKILGNSCFSDCKRLERAILKGEETAVPSMAFNGCLALREVVMPENIVSIGANAFRGCDSLIAFTIPENINEVQLGAFADCGNLRRVDFENPYCVIADSADTFPERTTLFAAVSSTAMLYAEKYSRNFTALDRLRGDYDGDGILTVADASGILALYARGAIDQDYTPPAPERYAADYNRDGTIAISDAYEVLVLYAQAAVS